MREKIFICHSSADHGFVEKLAKRMKRDDFDVWIDDWELKVGDSIVEKINEALKESSFFVIVLSEHSIGSDWVQRELNSTLMRQISKKDIKVLPILLDIEQDRVPPLLGDIYAARFSADLLTESEYSKFIEPIGEKAKSKSLRQYQDIFFENVVHVDLILKKDKPTKHEIEFILKLIQQEHYERYFLRKVKSLCWFDILKSQDYFSSNKAPTPEKADDEGYYRIPEWNVLSYLERVSEQVTVPDNEKYVDELISIIKKVTEHHIQNNKKLDNPRTWWYFVIILLNIPNEKIPLDIIQLIPVWLDSKFDNILLEADVSMKLLPKFLESPSPDDWKKAEKIIESITTIKWKEMPDELRKGLFGKEKEAKTVVDNHWLLETFKANAGKVGKKCSENVIFAIADRLKEIFRGKNPQHHIDFGYQDKNYWIIVEHLHDFEFDCSVDLVKGVDTKEKDLTEQLLTGVEVEREKIFGFAIKDCKNKECFIVSTAQEIRKHPPFENVNSDFNRKLEGLYEGVSSDYSYIWFESIFSPSDLTIHGAEQTLTLILRDITLEKARHDNSTAPTIFQRFLGEQYQYPLFKRIVLYVIGKEWNAFRDKFWEILSGEDGETIFDNYNLFAELYTLMEHNVAKFSKGEKEKIKTIIKKGPQRYLPEDKQDQYITYWKQEWYSSMKSDPFFSPLYEEQRKITNVEEHISFKEPKSFIGPGPAPLSKEEILRMTSQELVHFLRSFKMKDRWRGPTIRGLSVMLKVVVQEEPKKFIEELSAFIDVGYLYVYEILSGIKDAWNQKKLMDWGKLLAFVRDYVDREDFWQDKFKIAEDDFGANHRWIIGEIGELIQEGTRDDAWAFPEDHLHTAQEILFVILDKHKLDEEEINGAVDYTLNSPLGKIITALIYLALRIARIEDKQEIKREPRWNQAIRGKYDKLMKPGVIEAYTLVGQYMPNFNYLDKDWIREKIESISLEEHGKHWEAFMEGYLLGSRLYDSLYQLMKPHYLKAIEYDFKERHANERLVEHISLQYLHGKENIDNPESLFRRLIHRWNARQIEKMIGFFWMQRDYLGESMETKPKAVKPFEIQQMTERIVRFWKWVYENKYKGRQAHELNEEDKQILSDLSKLTVFLSKIDSENFEWLIASAPHVHIGFDSPFFIKYLDNLKDRDRETTKYVGELFLKMLDNFTPEYDQKHIRSIVEYLYQSGEKEKADRICNIYGPRGFDFLRDLYEKYQQKITQ